MKLPEVRGRRLRPPPAEITAGMLRNSDKASQSEATRAVGDGAACMQQEGGNISA